ncbi:MAG: SusC/RagA family TonB-linked outer membrane protein [Bacteroidota bacterium]
MKRICLLLFITFIVPRLFGQVTGLVYDEKNNTAPGVNIVVQGTSTGTITDFSGAFRIQARPGDTLLVSYVGYETFRLGVVRSDQNFTVNLTPATIGLTEVVVLGYNSKSRTEISSAVSVLSEDKLNDTPSNDIAGLIQGKVSGVQVVTSSGLPGSGSEIRIRGVSTMNAGNSEPLYVVDGIIGGSFDPSDVETLTVLKDAGATGMYGVRANSGVIIVTTKSAKSGRNNLEFKATYGYNFANQGNLKMMDGQQFYDLSAEQYRDPETHTIDKIRFYSDYPKTLLDYNYDWVGMAFKPAPVQKYYLSSSRRVDKLSYYLSGTYYNEKGTYRNTGFEKINLRANTNIDLNSRVSFRNNINLSASRGDSYDYMDMYYTYLGVPWDNPFNADGTARYIDGKIAKKIDDGTGWWSRDPFNPFHSIDNSDHNYKSVGVDYDMVLEIKLTSWLTFSSSNRLSFSTGKNHNFISPIVAGTYNGKGYIAEDQTMWFGGLSTNLLRFNKDMGEHSLSGLIGEETERGYFEALGLSGTGLPVGFSVPSTASAQYTISGNNGLEILRSLISQVNYDYRKTFFLTASYRVDASSNFPVEHRIAQFPTVSGSVLLNKLGFMSSASSIDLLKVRLSYGYTGNPNIGAARYMGLFDLSTQYNNYSAAVPQQLGNPDLTWEKTRQLNLGIDLELKRRVTMNLDLYNNRTSDLIIQAALPLSMGFESRYENLGYVVNKGLELTLSTINVQTQDFEFSTDISVAYNSNILQGINAPSISTVGGVSQIYQNGQELYSFYLPKWLGVDEATGGPLWEKITRDDNGDIISREPTSNYSEADPQIVGSALPKLTGGLGLNISYKNISLHASGAFQYGNQVYNSTRIFMDSDGHEPYYNNMIPKSTWSRWEKPGDVATHPSMQNNSLSKETSSRYLEDGGFFKIRDVSLSFGLPKAVATKLKVQDISVVLTGNNLFTFTPFWGQDPEATMNKLSWSMPGVIDFKYPINRQYLLSLNIKF